MEFLYRFKKILMVLIVLFCIAAIIATINYRFRPTFLDNAIGYVVNPPQRAVTKVSQWVNTKTQSFGNTADLASENAMLRARVEELTGENNRLMLVESESKKLHDLLKTDEKYPELDKVGADTIARDPSNWFNTFIINKGTKQGFSNDLVVLASGGLVGRIIQTNASYSKVVSIIDDTSSVSVQCLRTEDLGVVKGDLLLMKSGLCRMDYIELDAQIMPGDELITSHLGDIYPPGITVGIVKEVKLDPKGLTKYAIIQPTVDFQNIETVLVLTQKFSGFKGFELDEQEAVE